MSLLNEEMMAEARRYFIDGNYKMAEPILQQMLLNNTRNPEVYQMLATIFYDKGSSIRPSRPLSALSKSTQLILMPALAFRSFLMILVATMRAKMSSWMLKSCSKKSRANKILLWMKN